MDRIYHSYEKWEDHKYNFYANAGKSIVEKHFKAIESLLCDPTKCEEYMMKVILEWKYSCEHNLTNPSLNKIAYLGQAACSMFDNIPAKATMASWSKLPLSKRNEADRIAKKVLLIWESENES